jgi:ribosomal protein L17
MAEKAIKAIASGKNPSLHQVTEVVMNLQQQSALKKIMAEFGRNFAESEVMHQRHTEMINAVNLADVERAWTHCFAAACARKF